MRAVIDVLDAGGMAQAGCAGARLEALLAPQVTSCSSSRPSHSAWSSASASGLAPISWSRISQMAKFGTDRKRRF